MDEKQRILKMVEEGKMSAGEALELLEALGEVQGKETPAARPKGRKKMLRIRIDAGEKGSGKAKVNVNLPLSVAKKLTSLTKVIPESAKTEMEKEGFNIDELNLKELIEAIEEGEMDENLVDIVADEEDGKAGATVKIYVD